MTFFIFLILFSTTIFSVNAQAPACQGIWGFEKPTNEPYVTWYPQEFPQSNAPLIQDNFDCSYEISVQKGYSARVTLTVNVTNPSGISSGPVWVTNQFGKTEEISDADRIYFYFVANGGTIRLSTQNGKVQFGFRIDWQEYDTNPAYSTIHVNQSDTLPFLQSPEEYSYTTITADTRVSMTVISPAYDFYYCLLRGILIFDGPDIYSPSLGTAYDIYTGQTQFVSTGNQMTIQSLLREDAPILPMLLYQDYSNTRDIVQFQGVFCPSANYCGLYPMDASNGPVALQTIYSANYAEPDVLTDIIGFGTLGVFMGGVTKDKKNSIAIYNAATSSTYLPQLFSGPLKTYVLLNGKATLNLTRDYDEFGNTKSFGRKGFIASTFYGQLSGQHGFGDVHAPIGYTDASFRLKIGSIDMTGETVFWIDAWKNGTETFDEIYNSTVLPDTKNAYSLHGDHFRAYYDTDRSATNGCFMRFEVNQPAP
ncbi:unnamed protein product [Caenorhabditis brenneri]